MLKVMQPAQMRREDAADRPLIGRPVSIPADCAKDRTSIQAGAATNAIQHITLLGIGQQLTPPVI